MRWERTKRGEKEGKDEEGEKKPRKFFYMVIFSKVCKSNVNTSSRKNCDRWNHFRDDGHLKMGKQTRRKIHFLGEVFTMECMSG